MTLSYSASHNLPDVPGAGQLKDGADASARLQGSAARSPGKNEKPSQASDANLAIGAPPLAKYAPNKVDIKTEQLPGDLLQRLQELAHNVLLNRSYNSTALVLFTLDLLERFQ